MPLRRSRSYGSSPETAEKRSKVTRAMTTHARSVLTLVAEAARWAVAMFRSRRKDWRTLGDVNQDIVKVWGGTIAPR
jgi:hypothetical protein